MRDLATALVYYGGALVFVCACGAAAERWLLKTTPSGGFAKPYDQEELES